MLLVIEITCKLRCVEEILTLNKYYHHFNLTFVEDSRLFCDWEVVQPNLDHRCLRHFHQICGMIFLRLRKWIDAIGQNRQLQMYSQMALFERPPVNLTAVAVKFLNDAFTPLVLKKLRANLIMCVMIGLFATNERTSFNKEGSIESGKIAYILEMRLVLALKNMIEGDSLKERGSFCSMRCK